MSPAGTGELKNPADGHAGPGELAFQLPGGGHALFTTVAEGNLSTGSGEGHEQGLRRRAELCERLGLRWLCSSRQVHGRDVHVIDRLQGAAGDPVALDADAHVTALSGVGAMVLAADCLPIVLARGEAVAAVHAGWRGLAAGVIEAAALALADLGGAGQTVAIVGPGAGVCCYEVGPEVHEALAGLAGQLAGDIARRGRCDMRAIAHEQLRRAGVEQVGDVAICTICDTRFFSHRREGVRAGRQAAIAWSS